MVLKDFLKQDPARKAGLVVCNQNGSEFPTPFG